MTAAVPEPQPVDEPDALTITRLDDGSIRIENAHLPERIAVAKDLWDELEEYDPAMDGDTGLEPPAAWLESIPHAGHVDTDGNPMAVQNDGYVLHIDAVNVVCSYRFSYGPAEGRNATGLLVSWGEK